MRNPKTSEKSMVVKESISMCAGLPTKKKLAIVARSRLPKFVHVKMVHLAAQRTHAKNDFKRIGKKETQKKKLVPSR